MKKTVTEGEACKRGGPDQLVGIIDCVPDLACCLPPEDSKLRVDAPKAHDTGHAGDGQCPEGPFDTGEDTDTR